MTDNRPNILWICTDQQRFDTVGAAGNTIINTPNLDRLAANGTLFDKAYSQAPICTPSRASFLTGMYASTIHACSNGNASWAEAAPLVTKLLADEGYDCGLCGKLHLAGAKGRIEPRPADDGYRFFSWSHHATDDWSKGHDYADWVRSRSVDPTAIYQENHYFPTELHQTTWCTNEAIRFIDSERSGPWLMSVNYFDPHTPFDPPPEYRERYPEGEMPGPHFQDTDLAAQAKLAAVDFQTPARRPEEFDAKAVQGAYYGMIELIDDNLGRLIDHLESTGQRDNTLIIFTSDHGESLGDHGLLNKGCRFYEGLVRVPLIISWPARFRACGRSNALVELTDIAPTLLEVAGMATPVTMTGRSLVPILSGASPADHHRDSVRSEYYRALDYIGTAADEPCRFATMIRDDRYKLVCYHGHPVGELFDLDADPWEHDNLWDDPAHGETRFRLMEEAFAQTVLAVDRGTEIISGY